MDFLTIHFCCDKTFHIKESIIKSIHIGPNIFLQIRDTIFTGPPHQVIFLTYNLIEIRFRFFVSKILPCSFYYCHLPSFLKLSLSLICCFFFLGRRSFQSCLCYFIQGSTYEPYVIFWGQESCPFLLFGFLFFHFYKFKLRNNEIIF